LGWQTIRRGRFAPAALVSAALLGFFAAPANAVPLTVGSSVSAGGAVYSLSFCAINGGSCSASTGQFTVNGGGSIKITGAGGGNLLSTSSTNQDLTLQFYVTGVVMNHVNLGMGGSGFAFAVDENVSDLIPVISVSMHTDQNSLTDAVSFAAQSALIIDKDITLAGSPTGAPNSISFVTQSVPEPSGLSVLLLAGAMGLARRRRGRSRSQGNTPGS
jgi:hypothetical protein